MVRKSKSLTFMHAQDVVVLFMILLYVYTKEEFTLSLYHCKVCLQKAGCFREPRQQLMIMYATNIDIFYSGAVDH